MLFTEVSGNNENKCCELRLAKVEAGVRTIVRFLTGFVWLVNGIYCKVLDEVPRHGEIVEEFAGGGISRQLTVAIGVGEVCLALWIWSGFRRKICGWVQIGLVMTMNVVEQIIAPDLLLWGGWNFLWAVGFCLVVWWAFIRKGGQHVEVGS